MTGHEDGHKVCNITTLLLVLDFDFLQLSGPHHFGWIAKTQT